MRSTTAVMSWARARPRRGIPRRPMDSARRDRRTRHAGRYKKAASCQRTGPGDRQPLCSPRVNVRSSGAGRTGCSTSAHLAGTSLPPTRSTTPVMSSAQACSVAGCSKGTRTAGREHEGMADLGTPGGRLSSASAINNGGQVVGSASTSDEQTRLPLDEAGRHDRPRHPRWRKQSRSGHQRGSPGGRVEHDGRRGDAPVPVDEGTAVDLGTLGLHNASAAAVNERGDVLVVGTTESGTHARSWNKGHVRELGTLGGSATHAAAMNDQGDVVGTSFTALGEQRAFVWKSGHMVDLGTLGGPGAALSRSTTRPDRRVERNLDRRACCPLAEMTRPPART